MERARYWVLYARVGSLLPPIAARAAELTDMENAHGGNTGLVPEHEVSKEEESDDSSAGEDPPPLRGKLGREVLGVLRESHCFRLVNVQLGRM